MAVNDEIENQIYDAKDFNKASKYLSSILSTCQAICFLLSLIFSYLLILSMDGLNWIVLCRYFKFMKQVWIFIINKTKQRITYASDNNLYFKFQSNYSYVHLVMIT